MTEDKKDFKRVRRSITKVQKDLSATSVRLEEVSAFIDKLEYKLYEQLSEDFEDDEDVY